jgi:putative transcriptional regulator
MYPRIEVEAASIYSYASEKKTELARGKFLVASRELIDLNFSQSVVLLIEYGPNGAMGLIINRPTEVRLKEVLPDMEEFAYQGEALFVGGPVARNQLLMLLRSGREIEGTHLVFEDVYASTSRTVLEEMVNHSGAGESLRVYAGYAGWAPGQLDQEFARGDWHVLRADKETVFEKESSQIWNEFIRWFAGQWVRIRPLSIG